MGEGEAFGSGFGGEGGVAGGELGVDGGGVRAGELEAVEDGGGAAGVELAGGEGVDDDGEGDLDGLAVFEGGELDVLAGHEVSAGGFGVAKALVAAVEVLVEEAPRFSVEGWRLAASSVGANVSAELEFHDVTYLFPEGTHPLPYLV